MDSSRKQDVMEEELSAWQIERLRDRLINYKKMKRHGWERVATDILYVDDLPATYLDAEEVRPLSESLRRLVNGSQTPSLPRLNAVKLFLIAEGHLTDGELDQGRGSINAPLAFVEFISGGLEGGRQRLDTLSPFEGTYSNLHDSVQYVTHESLSLVYQAGFFKVSFSRTYLRKIDNIERMLRVPSVRKRAAWREDCFEGWAACGPLGQIVLFALDKGYERPPTFSLVWAEKTRSEGASPVTELLLLPYQGASSVSDPEALRAATENPSGDLSERLEILAARPKLQSFTRDVKGAG